jgi:hypothetical protein
LVLQAWVLVLLLLLLEDRLLWLLKTDSTPLDDLQNRQLHHYCQQHLQLLLLLA